MLLESNTKINNLDIFILIANFCGYNYQDQSIFFYLFYASLSTFIDCSLAPAAYLAPAASLLGLDPPSTLILTTKMNPMYNKINGKYNVSEAKMVK
jgi:hypothetical protein